MDEPSVTEERRSGVEEPSMQTEPPRIDAFHRLPDEIIEQILFSTDPDGFASLTLLNSKWRATSQRSHLYTHHLSQCRTSAVSSDTFDIPSTDHEHLALLRRLFARQVKRGLFQAYLRPRKTLVKLVSNSISSSSSPGGEGMQFSSSPNGHLILACNSSRIYVIDVGGPTVDVRRELKILRRPVSACITDDAQTLAVLSNEMQIDIYNLRETPPRRKQSLILDNSPQTIALSPCGNVLAAAYNGGVEVLTLNPSASPNEKRAVKCDAVEALSFSRDGTQILGTTVHSTSPSTVVLTAPYHNPGSQTIEDNLSAMWTTSILFPNTSHDCSHAIWLPDTDYGEPEWAFAYDRSFESFRAVRLDDLRNGTTYFTGPLPNPDSHLKLSPCTLPGTTGRGDLVSVGFESKDIWVYGVPQDLNVVPEVPPANFDLSPNRGDFARHVNTRSSSILSGPASSRDHDGESDRVPQWQAISDQKRNRFFAGSKVAEFQGVSSVRWVGQQSEDPTLRERLIVTAPGIMGPRLITDEEDIEFVDGGRIALLDFDYDLANGETVEVTIEVGTDNAEPLQEERRDLEADVAIVRRRTVAQRRGGSSALLRAAATASIRPSLTLLTGQHNDGRRGGDGGGGGGDGDDGDDPLVPRTIGQMSPSQTAGPSPEAVEEVASIEEQEAMDAPYAHSSPRSQTTLRRAATAAAVNRRLHPRTADGRPIEYRRADGRSEHPHESDADKWVPPPPPYQKEDPGDLPAFLRGPSVAPMVNANLFSGPSSAPTSDRFHSLLSLSSQSPDRAGSDSPRSGRLRPRTLSDSASMSRLKLASSVPRPRSTPSSHPTPEEDDLYDVSSQGSPPPSSPVARLARSPPPQSTAISPSPSSGQCSSPASAEVMSASTTGTGLSPTRSAAGPQSPASSTGPEARPEARPEEAPTLGLHIPTSPAPLTMRRAVEEEPETWKPANARTWPRQAESAAAMPKSVSTEPTSVHPNTAPPSSATWDLFASAAAFPVPSSTQMASLNKRISQGSPRRLSGIILYPELWKGAGGRGTSEAVLAAAQSSSGSAAPSMPPMPPTPPTPSVSTVVSAARRPSDIQVLDCDRPLIISTPTGITGFNDEPSRRASNELVETPILAPVPRRPQASAARPGGTAAQLENIYGNQPAPAPLPAHMRSNANMLPMWMRTPSNSSRRTPSGVNRRRSRAERSAAKNIKDAKLRGWRANKKKNDKQPTPDSSGWVNVLTPSQPKAGKCVVM